MSSQDELEGLRARLQAADDALTEALDARVDTMRQLLAFRANHPDLYSAAGDDAAVIRRAAERAKSFPVRDLEAVFREVLAVSGSLEAERRVSYSGDRGGFAELAARAHFGRVASLAACPDVASALAEVEGERASFAVVPLESSSDGAVTATLNGLATSELSICAERTLRVRYHLVSASDRLVNVEKVYGGAAALAACERQLQSKLPRATLLDVPAAEVAAELCAGDPSAAALSVEPELPAHGLGTLVESIQDDPDGATRFAVVGSRLPSRTGRDRTVIAMVVGDRPGALHASLAPFADRDINLTRLESRPARGSEFRYRFFVEMDGHVTDRQIATALDRVREICPVVKVLGSYPRPERGAMEMI